MDTNISLGEALKYCASLPSYWIWIGVVIILLAGGLIGSEIFGRKKNIDVSNFKMIWSAIFIILLAIAIGKDPTNVQQNTTKAQAARGVYIGL